MLPYTKKFREILHLLINLPLDESVPGTTHNLWHPQMLPLPAAVPAQSGHHPGQKEYLKLTTYGLLSCTRLDLYLEIHSFISPYISLLTGRV